jgi:hypothetical protein
MFRGKRNRMVAYLLRLVSRAQGHMFASAKASILLWMAGWLGLTVAFAAEGAWKFEIDERDHPQLMYQNDKVFFFVGCGHAFALHAAYPGGARKEGAKATLTIANGKMRMNFRGEIAGADESDPPGTTHFVQWDLGFRRQDPALYGRRWKRREDQLFDLLDSGRPLTVSAGGRSYRLPAVHVPKWRKRFREIC